MKPLFYYGTLLFALLLPRAPNAPTVAQLTDSIEVDRAFVLATDYVQDPSAPADGIRLYQNNVLISTQPPTTGVIQFTYSSGLGVGTYALRPASFNAGGESSGPTLTLTVFDPQPPPVSPIVMQARTCEWNATIASAPTTQSGWVIQFRFVNANGTFQNFNSPDYTVPYQRLTGLVAPGTHVIGGLWTRSGSASVVVPGVTKVCS